jgi:hypothetical protein
VVDRSSSESGRYDELILPSHPRLRNDERLSSWVLRVASGNLVSVKQLCHQLGTPRVDHLDFKSRDHPLVIAMSRATATAVETVREALPCSLYGLFGERSADAWFYPIPYPWQLSGSSSRFEGGQYCPICLDQSGYYRLRWRIAIYSCCPMHGCFLRDRCPDCNGKIVDVCRLFGSYVREPDAEMQVCRHCNGSLVKGVPLQRAMPKL